jgi:small subunit ribosomal protein S1
MVGFAVYLPPPPRNPREAAMSTDQTNNRPPQSDAAVLPDEVATVSVTEDGIRASVTSHPTVVRVGEGEEAPKAPPKRAPKAPVKTAVENEVVGADDFAALFAEGAGGGTSDDFEPGQEVEAVIEVISMHGEEIFLDLGGKATGYMLKEEVRGEDGEVTVKQGDTVKGIVAGVDSNGVHVRTSLAGGGTDREALRGALESGIPVEGKVTAVNKGGFEVALGRTRAFCPMSQIDLYRPEDGTAFIGKTMTFLVTELRDGKDPVLSRAAILRAEREQKASETRAHVVPGARLSGHVRSIQSFGAFVDLGGLDGLVHVSELSWSRVEDPKTVVRVGQQVEVVVLDVDEEKGRIALSIRQAEGDPFADAAVTIQVGTVVTGNVARITNFGAFVTLAPHVDGLIHISDMAHHRVRHPKDLLNIGDAVQVKVTDVDLERRRIGLSLKALSTDPWDAIGVRYKVGAEVTGTVAKVADFGVFVDLEPGVTGLLPGSESGVPKGKSLQIAFKPGQSLTLRVLRVDVAAQKMALTTREEVKQGEGDSRGGGRRNSGGGESGGRGRRPSVAWSDPGEKPQDTGAGVGSLGALLMAALDKPEKK